MNTFPFKALSGALYNITLRSLVQNIRFLTSKGLGLLSEMEDPSEQREGSTKDPEQKERSFGQKGRDSRHCNVLLTHSVDVLEIFAVFSFICKVAISLQMVLM